MSPPRVSLCDVVAPVLVCGTISPAPVVVPEAALLRVGEGIRAVDGPRPGEGDGEAKASEDTPLLRYRTMGMASTTAAGEGGRPSLLLLCVCVCCGAQAVRYGLWLA